jgi:hypothetical protein
MYMPKGTPNIKEADKVEITNKELRIHTLRGDVQELMMSGFTKYGTAEYLEKRFVTPGGEITADEFYRILNEEYSKRSGQKAPAKKRPAKTLDQFLTDIAKEHCFVETLETRKSDSLDFHDVSVWGLKAALEAAYNAGFEAGARKSK